MEKVLNQILTELKNLNQWVGSVEEGQQRMEARMDGFDAHMDKFDTRMDRLENSNSILAKEIMTVKTDVKEIHSTLVKFENEIKPQIGALSDGYSLRGDQINNLRKHFDERFDSIEIDTGYLVTRVARLEKTAK